MSDGITAYYDACDRYEYLCKKYVEKTQGSLNRHGIYTLECYGEHRRKLELREEQEGGE